MTKNLDLICYSLAALTLAVPGLFLVARWAWRRRKAATQEWQAAYEWLIRAREAVGWHAPHPSRYEGYPASRLHRMAAAREAEARFRAARSQPGALIRAAKESQRQMREFDARIPQPDAPYGSKPDPDDAPVSRREFDKIMNVVAEDTGNNHAAILKLAARLDAIEKPVKKCGRCGGCGMAIPNELRLDSLVTFVRRCNYCNGTGREEA